MVDRTDGLKQTMPGVPREWVERLVTSDDATDSLEAATRSYHVPTITPEAYTPAPTFGPTELPLGNVMSLEFSSTSDNAYRIFKIDGNYVGNAAFHIHWTKSGNTAETGSPSVLWRLHYTVFPGDNADFVTDSNRNHTVIVSDTYDNTTSGTTRLVYRTPDVEAEGFIAGYYVGVRAEYATNNMVSSNPCIISVDLTWDGAIHDV